MAIVPMKDKDIIHRRELCCIRGLLEVISFINGASYHILGKPDFDNHTTKACDATASIGENNFAIEHTRITSIPNQIDDYELKQKFFAPLFSEFQKRLPPDCYTLIIDRVPKNKNNIWDIYRNEIKEFCFSVVNELKPNENHLQKSISFKSDIIPFTFIRMKSKDNEVKITMERWSHPDKLTDVLRKCLNDFEPKMSKYKLDGYQTVLLLELEVGDISDLTSNNIIEAFLSIKANLTEFQVPDHIYLIETGFLEWTVIKLNTHYESWEAIAEWIPEEKKVIRWNNISWD
jgi:hypothetical protein